MGTVANEKAMTLRLSSWQHIGVRCIAEAEGKSISDVVREAIESYIEARKLDPEFQRRVHAQIEANQSILEQFAGENQERSEP